MRQALDRVPYCDALLYTWGKVASLGSPVDNGGLFSDAEWTKIYEAFLENFITDRNETKSNLASEEWTTHRKFVDEINEFPPNNTHELLRALLSWPWGRIFPRIMQNPRSEGGYEILMHQRNQPEDLQGLSRPEEA